MPQDTWEDTSFGEDDGPQTFTMKKIVVTFQCTSALSKTKQKKAALRQPLNTNLISTDFLQVIRGDFRFADFLAFVCLINEFHINSHVENLPRFLIVLKHR